MLLLHSCYSGDYYYRVFNHETLFFTTDPPHFGDGTPETYIHAIMDGKTRTKIHDALEGLPGNPDNIVDWWKF
jgi:hypothetical protein